MNNENVKNWLTISGLHNLKHDNSPNTHYNENPFLCDLWNCVPLWSKDHFSLDMKLLLMVMYSLCKNMTIL